MPKAVRHRPRTLQRPYGSLRWLWKKRNIPGGRARPNCGTDRPANEDGTMGERALWPPDRLSLMISVGLAMLAIPALAQPRPKPVGKVVGPCPIGYRYATGSCTPLNRWSRVAFVKKGPCPIGWSHLERRGRTLPRGPSGHRQGGSREIHGLQ